jgi:hypothetical protein
MTIELLFCAESFAFTPRFRREVTDGSVLRACVGMQDACSSRAREQGGVTVAELLARVDSRRYLMLVTISSCILNHSISTMAGRARGTKVDRDTMNEGRACRWEEGRWLLFTQTVKVEK